MTFSKVPWLVDGPITKAELARSALYAAMGGAGGITNVGDCRVLATTVPSGSVRVTAGTVTVISRYPGVSGQAYILDNNSDHLITVPPTGSSGRSDLVVVAVNDPQYSGSTPSNWDTFSYADARLIPNVSPSRTDADDFDGPYEALARIDIPANNSGIVTPAMIVNLRRVARPRKERLLRTSALVAGQTDTLTTNGGAGEAWPDPTWTMTIPSWATTAKVIGTLTGVRDPGGNALGTLWARIGALGDSAAIETQTVGFNSPAGGNVTRQTLSVADDIAVPLGLRGRTVPVYLKATYGTPYPASANRLVLDGASSALLDIEFTERATSDV